MQNMIFSFVKISLLCFIQLKAKSLYKAMAELTCNDLHEHSLCLTVRVID